MQGALSNIRVLDLSRILAGPWCTQNLADLGAEVIKVERPVTGDDTRHWGPPWIRDGEGSETTDSTYFASANRNKKSIAVDIASAAGQALIRELVAESDVLVENYKVGDLARYGLAYDDLRKINPRLIYCSITGYGQSGPSAHRPGYDFVFQGMGGLMSITGERDDLPGGGPQKVGVAITDVMTGMYACVAILAAVNARSMSGVGQYIDMALLDCIVAFGGNQANNYVMTGQVPKRSGNAHPALVPYQVFATTNGHIIVAAGNDTQWQRLCKVMARADLASDPRFNQVSGRITHREALIVELERAMLTRSSEDWLAALEEGGIPVGPINDYAQVFADPQVQHRQLQVALPRPEGGTLPAIASPLRLSETPVTYRSAPPTLGQNTDEVLRSVLGKTPEQLDMLVESGTIAR
ncbi:CoA transferase [Glaciimonas sp. Gout2]|uniref:CaiB/BaiF CoA transferase family protein n=1 Tax=unclassified Glaciimonas TaxID=2644401 RepID=UPI002B222A92|nr:MULTISPECIES: CoA transferase [unclassified Glaciimonas]MEB0010182.1 CoA transferase [Glaciimonas sp. Cout2]MEB0084313.1 CoA transferase [Glaciimonas sp. Gout2]